MGQGYGFKCKKCNHEYSVSTGVGFIYPSIYEDTIKAAQAGKYGEEWRQLIDSKRYMDIDASEQVFVCECGNWKNEMDLSVYEPKNESRIKKLKFGELDVSEMNHLPYVMKYDRDRLFKLVKEYPHMCDKCGKQMKLVDEDSIDRLACPKCGEVNETRDFICFD